MSSPPYSVRVETAEDSGKGRKSRYAPKGRSFGAKLVAVQMAHGFWENSERDPLRPTFALFATTAQEERPFLMNLKSGRKVRVDGIGYVSRGGWPMEFLKSAGYTFDVQRTKAGSLIEIALPEVMEYRPGMADAEEVKFVLSLEREKLIREQARLPQRGIPAILRRYKFEKRKWYEGDPYDPETVVAEGLRFAAAVDMRAPEIPIVQDTRFTTQLLLSALRDGPAKRNQRAGVDFSPDDRDGVFFEAGMGLAKRAPGLAFRMRQDQLAQWVSQELQSYEAHR